MKLSPQLASVLLSSMPKGGPAALNGKDAFAAAMQDLMASPSAAMVQGPVGGLPEIAAQTKPVTPCQEVHTPAGEEHIGTDHVLPETLIPLKSNAVAPVPRDGIRPPVAPQSGGHASLPTEESSELPIPMPEAKVKNPVQDVSLWQPPFTPPEPGVTRETHGPAHPEHKARTMEREATDPATPSSPDTSVPATAPLQSAVPFSMQQPGGSEHVLPENNVPPAVHSLGKPGGNRRDPSVSLPIMMDSATASNKRNELQQVAQARSATEAIRDAGERSAASVGNEKTIPSATSRSNQALLPGSMLQPVHSKEDHQTTVLQVDAHIPQEAGKESMTVTKPVGAAEPPPIHPALDPSPVEHQSPLNTPAAAPAMHRSESLTETHRAQANAAQVLQRMDTAAPSGAVQLRADARHLDVGVSSSALGWVEVRATASTSGRVNAALHVQTSSSAHLLTAQSKEIATYAREHSVDLGQISVGVGTGDSARGNSRSMQDAPQSEDTAAVKKALKTPVNNEPHQPVEKVSFISIRA